MLLSLNLDHQEIFSVTLETYTIDDVTTDIKPTTGDVAILAQVCLFVFGSVLSLSSLSPRLHHGGGGGARPTPLPQRPRCFGDDSVLLPRICAVTTTMPSPALLRR